MISWNSLSWTNTKVTCNRLVRLLVSFGSLKAYISPPVSCGLDFAGGGLSRTCSCSVLFVGYQCVQICAQEMDPEEIGPLMSSGRCRSFSYFPSVYTYAWMASYWGFLLATLKASLLQAENGLWSVQWHLCFYEVDTRHGTSPGACEQCEATKSGAVTYTG